MPGRLSPTPLYPPLYRLPQVLFEMLSPSDPSLQDRPLSPAILEMQTEFLRWALGAMRAEGHSLRRVGSITTPAPYYTRTEICSCLYDCVGQA
jgi:hypothetical protein